MNKKKEFQVDTVNLPTEYDINIYKLRRAFDKIKKCPYCYSSVNLSVDYYRSNIYILHYMKLLYKRYKEYSFIK